MARLTDDMNRLCDEISALRNARKSFISNLKQGVASIQTSVAVMEYGFHTARSQMARKMRRERAEFISDLQKMVSSLKKAVAGMRKEFAADLKGASRVWAGKDL